MTASSGNTKHLRRALLLATFAALASGCDRGDSSSADSGAARPLVAAFHAVPDMGSITFLREEETWSTLEFGAATSFRDVARISTT